LAYYDKSAASLEYFLTLDPAYDKTYFILSDIARKRGDDAAAARWLDGYIKGPPGVTNPAYLAVHKNNPEATRRRALLKP
jgi:hypothetical protein